MTNAFYIRIKNGAPFEHPITHENLKLAFPGVDTNNLPEWLMLFERVNMPSLGVYDVYLGATYAIENGVCKDVHNVRPMTAEEKAAKIAEYLAYEHPENWVFSEEFCTWIPPSMLTINDGSEPNVIG
jgi:hypothetical protein